MSEKKAIGNRQGARGKVLGFAVFIFVFFVGYGFGMLDRRVEGKDFPTVTINRNVSDERNLDFSLFWNVWDTLEARYFRSEEIVDSELVYGAIKGMVRAVGDPYTVFLTPQENRVTQEDLKGNFEGVGIQIGFKGTSLAVIAPLPDTPAEEAGVRAGDLIVGITDTERGVERGTVGITLPEAVQLIRGPAGSVVKLILLREGEDTPLEIDVKRQGIDVPSVTHEFLGEDESISYIRVLKFGGETLGEWEKVVLETLKKDNLEGIILDLRGNPGGYLQGAVDLGSEFVAEGEVIVIEEMADGAKSDFTVNRMGRLMREDVVILVDGGSASASEILTAALREHREFPVVGETTFGKGTIQEPQQLEGGVGLHITVARWLTPSEEWINEVGITPDYEVSNDPEMPGDEQLLKAMEILQS